MTFKAAFIVIQALIPEIEDTAPRTAYNWKPRFEKNAFKVLFFMYCADFSMQVPCFGVFG